MHGPGVTPSVLPDILSFEPEGNVTVVTGLQRGYGGFTPIVWSDLFVYLWV